MSIQYNERKVSAGEAEALCRVNMDGDDAAATRETFERYERLNIRSQEVCFHMSINPGPEDSITDGKAVELAGELLHSLGYDGQPYVVYRHNDIEREHYHILSIRVREDGRKIQSFQEHKTCQRALKALAPKYGFRIGSCENELLASRGISPRYFDATAGNITAQMEAVLDECLKYHFTSIWQFKQVMLDHNLEISLKGHKFLIQGLDGEGKKCTPPVARNEYIGLIMDRMQESLSEDRSKAAHRVAQIGAVLLPYSKSERHYVNMMLRKNIHTIFEKDSKGIINKATYIDHEGRNVFTNSDMGHDLSMSMIQDADKHQWEHYSAGQSSHLDIGTILFGTNGNSKGHEKDPKQKKKKTVNLHI